MQTLPSNVRHAIAGAIALLDSVAFVSQPGDADAPLAALRAVLETDDAARIASQSAAPLPLGLQDRIAGRSPLADEPAPVAPWHGIGATAGERIGEIRAANSAAVLAAIEALGNAPGAVHLGGGATMRGESAAILARDYAPVSPEALRGFVDAALDCTGYLGEDRRRFVVGSNAPISIAEYLEANEDDEAACAWALSARIGDTLPDGEGAERIADAGDARRYSMHWSEPTYAPGRATRGADAFHGAQGFDSDECRAILALPLGGAWHGVCLSVYRIADGARLTPRD